jgi:siroheme synthase (precorrin-2 oxidase/ferrochelatase)
VTGSTNGAAIKRLDRLKKRIEEILDPEVQKASLAKNAEAKARAAAKTPANVDETIRAVKRSHSELDSVAPTTKRRQIHGIEQIKVESLPKIEENGTPMNIEVLDDD